MENLTSKQKIILGVIACAMIVTIGYYFMQNLGGEEQEFEIYEEVAAENEVVENNQNTQTKETIPDIKVHVAGCVAEEGVVTLKQGDRIADAVEKAGGLTSDANIKDVNLAYVLKDGQKIYIPSNIEEEVAYITDQSGTEIMSTEGKNEEGTTMNTGKVNINTATQTELETLPGIGPSTALKIITYRDENGDFESIEDIKNVSGIGESKYEAIKDSIEV